MAILTSSVTYDLLLIIIGICVGIYLRFRLFSKYFWKRKNVPYLEPSFMFGNTAEANVSKTLDEVTSKIYLENRKHKLFGMWFFSKPMLLVQDLELIKKVLIKDFQHFQDRGISVNEELDPLNGHLVTLSGSKWRNLRVKLTPTFTSGKIKMMYPIMLDCAKELQSYLEPLASKEEVIDIKEVLAGFTTDIIGSCAFGIETNSLKNPNSDFRVYGKRIFRPSRFTFISSLLLFIFPNLDKYIPLKRIDSDVEKFFLDVVRETMEYREKNNIQRKDFMDLLIQLKNKGYVEDVDSKYENKAQVPGEKFTFEQAAAQAFVFFAGGFDTSSAAMTFAFYELAKRPEVLKKLQKEIDAVLKKHDNNLTYEALLEMEYLDCVINETMRLYPPAGSLFRECTKDYVFEDLGVKIEKGTGVLIPVGGLQRNPDYFPNPDIFQPERFLPEEKAKREQFAYLPFGEGPRICIGNRFGLLQSKIGLCSVLSKYEVHVADKTPIPIKLDPKSFIPTPINGMPLKITKRKLQ